jgi:hypothetical protein
MRARLRLDAAIVMGVSLLAAAPASAEFWARLHPPNGIVLNVWAAHRSDALLRPVDHLEPTSEYNLALDVAFGAYEEPWVQPRVSVDTPIVDLFDARVIDWLGPDPAADSQPLTAQFMYEEQLIQTPDEPGARVKEFQLDVKKIRNLWQGMPPAPFSPPDLPFVFGRVVFEVHTTGATGEAPFGIVIKREGRILGVMSARMCVAAGDAAASQCRSQALPLPRRSEHFEWRLRDKHDDRQEGILWNVWAALPSAPRAPLPRLRPAERHHLNLDLAAISYGSNEDGVYTRASGGSFRERLKEWSATKRTVDLDVLVIPDPRFFEPSRQAVAQLQVDLRRIQEFAERRPSIEGDPLVALARAGLPEFVYGRVSFEVTTRAASGLASVGLLVWHGGRPVDEVTVQVCIAGEPRAAAEGCRGTRDASALQGVDSLRLATEGSALPDAALHFVDLGDTAGVQGVFRDNSWEEGKYAVWSMGMDAQAFRGQLQDAYLLPISQAREEANLRTRGHQFFNFLFPQGERARDEFLAFAVPFLRRDALAEGYSAPSLFVRMIQQGPNPPLLIPLGLLAVPVDGQDRFLGYSVRIETPLENQTYQESPECLSRWVLALPPEGTGDQAIEAARREVSSLASGWSKQEPYDQMRQLAGWLDSPEKETERGVVVAVLSHHDRDKLYFYALTSPLDDPLTPSEVNRQFLKPSLAILNGCGTAGPGAVEMVRRFNRRGMVTILGTSTEVDGSMAGAFLRLLAEELAPGKAAATQPTISQAYFQVLKRLRETKPLTDGVKPYGPNALKFSLLGNGSLRVCPPVQ